MGVYFTSPAIREAEAGNRSKVSGALWVTGGAQRMAIGAIHLDWMLRVAQIGAFTPDSDLLDLGPQDVRAPRDVLSGAARRVFDPGPAEKWIENVCQGDRVRPDAQAEFYALFGAKRYRSADNIDPRAHFKVDLNDADA